MSNNNNLTYSPDNYLYTPIDSKDFFDSIKHKFEGCELFNRDISDLIFDWFLEVQCGEPLQTTPSDIGIYTTVYTRDEFLEDFSYNIDTDEEITEDFLAGLSNDDIYDLIDNLSCSVIVNDDFSRFITIE